MLVQTHISTKYIQFKFGEKPGLPHQNLLNLQTLKRLIHSLFILTLLLINNSYHMFIFLLCFMHY